MHIDFEIHGRVEVPDGTCLVPGMSNLFELPSGAVISVHPVIEMATSMVSDDHRDLTYGEAAALGVQLDLYDRNSFPG
jgi:hypothetical protein